MGKAIVFMKDNPVVVLDVVKYVLAGLVLFGVPIPPGLDVLAAGLVLAILTIVTRQLVTPEAKARQAVADALFSPIPHLGEAWISEGEAPADGTARG